MTVQVEATDVRFLAGGVPIDPSEGVARMFGRFELIGRLPAVRSPGPEVLMYRPPTSRDRTRLAELPARIWLRVQPRLWLTHDGDHLLLAPSDSLPALGA